MLIFDYYDPLVREVLSNFWSRLSSFDFGRTIFSIWKTRKEYNDFYKTNEEKLLYLRKDGELDEVSKVILELEKKLN